MSMLLKLYIGAVTTAGVFALAANVPRQFPRPALTLTLLAAMLVVSVCKLRIPLNRGESTLSMAYVVDFVALVAVGPAVAMLVAALGVLVQCTVRVRRRQPWYRTAFSMAAIVLGVGAAGWVVAALSSATAGINAGMLASLLAAGALYFAVNSGLVAGAVALSSGQSPVCVWRQHFLATAPACLVAAGAVGALHGAFGGDPFSLLALAAIPMVACYAAYAKWFRRVLTAAPPAVAA